MRKRLLIGAIALAVIGAGAAYFFGQAEGTVEYHKKRYLKACKYDTMDDVLAWVPFVGRALDARKEEQRELHFTALTNLGYLTQRVMVVSNCPADVITARLVDFMAEVQAIQKDEIPSRIRLTGAFRATNITVIGPAKHMSRWESYVRAMDAISMPETRQ